MTETWRWLLGIVAISGAIGLALLPRRETIEFPAVDPLRSQRNLAQWRWATQSELYRREHSRMLAQQAVTSPARVVNGIAVVRPASVPMGFEEQMLEKLSRTFVGVDRRRSNVELRLVLALDTTSTIDGVPVTRTDDWSNDVFPPGTVAPGVCVIVARAHSSRILREPRKTRYISWGDLGSPCWWYAAYGAPGKGVASWLDSTSYSAIVKHRYLGYSLARWDAFRYDADRITDSRFAACSADDATACERLILEAPRWHNRLRTHGWIGSRGWDTWPNWFAAALLARLERELGPDQFARIWKSDEPLASSIGKTRGVPFATLIREQVNVYTRAYQPGPIPSRSVLTAILGFGAALIAVGATAVSQRQTFS